MDAIRARLRISVRSRDHSADNILLSTNTITENSSDVSSLVTTFNNSVQRSASFNQPQEINETKLNDQPPVLKVNEEENNDNKLSTNRSIDKNFISIDSLSQYETDKELTKFNNSSPTKLISRSSSQEHIYDNLDVFKRPKPNTNLSSNDDEFSLSSSTSTTLVKTREHPISATRLRPVTMHVAANNDKQITNEFENVFNQFKKRGSIRRIQLNEEIIAETVSSASVEETNTRSIPSSLQTENEPTTSTNKTNDITPTSSALSRRKTVGGVHLTANNKVAANDNKPMPSWIDIAKQKQNKL